MFQRSNQASERAVALDPNRLTAASQRITNRVERGELTKAYEAAQALVKSRPESGTAHFTLASVLRYAGMHEESARECEIALEISPGNYQWRACAWGFMELGQTKRAMDFVGLDDGSEWAAFATPLILLRAGKVAEARESVKKVSPAAHYHRDLLEVCLGMRPPSESDKITTEAEASVLAETDPERWYYEGTIMAYCGKPEIALHMIKAAVEQNYCSYSALLSDPLLAKLRASKEFDEVLTAAHQCQQSVRMGSKGRLIKFLVGQRLDRERNPTWLPFPPEKRLPGHPHPHPQATLQRELLRSMCRRNPQVKSHSSL